MRVIVASPIIRTPRYGIVMPGHSSLPFADCVNLSAMPGIRVLTDPRGKRVDGRAKPGHDELVSVARCGHRRGAHAERPLRLSRPRIERESGNQEKTDEIDRIGLRRRDRPSRKTWDASCRAGLFFHAAVLLETARDWKGKLPKMYARRALALTAPLGS